MQVRAFAPLAAEPVQTWYTPSSVANHVPVLIGAGTALLGLGLAVWQWQRSRQALIAAGGAASAAATAVAGAAAGAAAGLAAGTAVLARNTVAADVPALVDGGELGAAAYAMLVDYSAKLGAPRELVNDDADRATAVARQMLAAT